MNDVRFDLVFEGEILEGFHIEQVREQFSGAFSLSAEKTAALFARKRAVLKSNIDEVTGQKFLKRLSGMGMKVALVPREKELTLEPLDEPVEKPVPGSGAAQDVTASAPGGSSVQQFGSGVDASQRPAPAQAAQRAPGSAGPAEQSALRHAAFQFHGNGREYFGIWIVNILLSIVTLGIYSAWAKVRNKQYFYGNTELEGATFEYTADPKKILIGRLIGFGLFLIYSFSGNFSFILGVLSFILLIVFFPWIVRQSLRFNARYSEYRNVPFRFTGDLKGAAIAFLLWPFLGIITLGILLPHAFYKQQQYIYNHHEFGTAPFSFDPPRTAYYKMFAILVGSAIGGALVIFLLNFLLGGFGTFLSVLLWLGGYVALLAYFSVTVANLKFGYAALGSHGFEPNWELASYFRMALVNTVLTAITLGLFIPWARVRKARYAAEHTVAVVDGDLDAFVAAEEKQVSTVGEGISDLFDFDIGA